MDVQTKWPKKVKGQIPYTLYVWLKRMADNRRMKVSEILLEIVEDAVKGPDFLGLKVMNWASDVRDESPNNVHFMASMRLMERFEYFKIWNKTARDSVAIRAILKAAYERACKHKSDTDYAVQGVLFL